MKFKNSIYSNIYFEKQKKREEMNSNQDLFETLVVIEFDSKCSQEVKHWLERKLKASKDKNGADLLTKFTVNTKNEVYNYFYNLLI